jgi:lysophospholipase L1-like esterase
MPTAACRRPPGALFSVVPLALAALLLGCAAAGWPTPGPSPAPSGLVTPEASLARLRYVALGDSYTIGTSVAAAERWPDQLVVRVPSLDLVANLGVNGFTSADVIEVELPQLAGLRPQLVTLLIGVNDVVQGVPETSYRGNIAQILDELVRLVGAEHVLVVTTPDYTVTPAGADYGDPATQSAAIRRNNAINTELAAARGIAVFDIYDLSLRAGADRSLVASDGLHPSGAQYALWVEHIAPRIDALIGR